MAKIYDSKTNTIYWCDYDIACAVEDAYWELTAFLALKELDGHDKQDKWYMAMAEKMNELIDLMNECPLNEADPNVYELL